MSLQNNQLQNLKKVESTQIFQEEQNEDIVMEELKQPQEFDKSVSYKMPVKKALLTREDELINDSKVNDREIIEKEDPSHYAHQMDRQNQELTLSRSDKLIWGVAENRSIWYKDANGGVMNFYQGTKFNKIWPMNSMGHIFAQNRDGLFL